MILFNTTATNQFTIIPRDYVSTAYMTIRDDSTNVTVDYTLVPRVAGVGNKDQYTEYDGFNNDYIVI